MKKQRLTWQLVALAIAGCNGTETGNPPAALDGFDTTACKSKLESAVGGDSKERADARHGADDGFAQASAMTNPRYNGLRCVVWQRMDEQRLHVEITNHRDGCGEESVWEPRVELTDELGLQLFLDNPTCTSAGCDSACTYDLSFDVHISESRDTLPVQLYDDGCDGERRLSVEALLPLASQERGEHCEYVDASTLEWQGCDSGLVGTRFAPCTGSVCGSASAMCQAGLQCGEVAPGDARCLLPCADDEDCAELPDSHCREGLCLL